MPVRPFPDSLPTASTSDHHGGEGSLVAAPQLRGAGERPGESIGPYRLLEVIGEGGFGVVYLAERHEPMVQRVALKIIKPGMDSSAVIARFEQERQALAVMDHPNVARVFDGGVTSSGRPYFVMEYVQGAPITSFADERRLTLRQRLELFIPVCEAVQHAHHKGLIHRDIKPSNVLVSEIEGKPVPKVIDFGVAKAIASSGWTNTAHTQSGMVIGTPEYMSPEQVAGELDVDTRADVYSLGVMLYELLTGELPFNSHELRKAALAEVARIIREVTPPKPSTRLAQLAGERTTTIAEARSATRERITSELRRELDWIPLMALRKERERRYPSPQALADDVQRYLEGQPLRAAPDSSAYLARKFVRRNKVQVFAASAVFVALTTGLGLALWQRNEALKARDAEASERARADERAVAAETAEKAEKERADQLKKVSEFQASMLSQIDTTKAGIDLVDDVHKRFIAALEKAGLPEADRTIRSNALRQELVYVNATDAAVAMINRTILIPAIKSIDKDFKNDPATDASLRQALAHIYETIGLYEASFPLQESALSTRRRVLGETHPDTISSINNMGSLLLSQGNLAKAEPYIHETLEKSRIFKGPEHPDTLAAINNMGVLLHGMANLDEAETYYREALEKRRRVLGEEHPDTIGSLNTLGVLLRDQGKFAEAVPYLRETLGKLRRVLGEEHSDTITSIRQLAELLEYQGKRSEAEPYYREALEKSRRVLGEDHPDTVSSIILMGRILQGQLKLKEAEPYYREVLTKQRRLLGEDHPNTLIAIASLGIVLSSQGKLSEAEPYYLEALEKRRRVLGNDDPATLASVSGMGWLLQNEGKFAEAEQYLREAIEMYRRVQGEGHPSTLFSVNNMGLFFQTWGKLAEAEPYLREALEKRRRLLGEEHSETLVSVSAVARLNLAQNKAREALDLITPYETAARKRFTGGNARQLADFLSALGQARAGVGFDGARFKLAEANLLEAHSIYIAAKDRGPTHKDTLACVQALVDLYTAWDTAESGKGYDAKAAEWKAKLPQPEPVMTEPAAAPADKK